MPVFCSSQPHRPRSVSRPGARPQPLAAHNNVGSSKPLNPLQQLAQHVQGGIFSGLIALGASPYALYDQALLATPDYVQRLLTLGIAGLIGLAAGTLFSPLLRPVRRFLRNAILVAILLYALFGPTPTADWLADGIAVICLFIAFFVGLRFGRRFIGVGAKIRPTSFGSAQWATEQHLASNGLLGGAGFVLGEFPGREKQHLLRYDGPRHLLTVAPTRSGKGVSSIIPNLLTYSGSAVVVDPKGENALITAYRRGPGGSWDGHYIDGIGQKLVLLDPWNIAASKLGLKRQCFNPLDWIKANDPDAAENAFLLADAMVPSTAQGEARFWDDEAKALLAGVVLYVATAPEESKSRHLGRVRDILTQDDDGFKATLVCMFNHHNTVVSSTAARTASKDPKLRSSVLASVQSHTHFLDSPRIRENLSRSDFRFEELKTSLITVYLILPADRLTTFDRWLRLLIQQAITVNARNIQQKPDKPILFLLDEMAAIGRLPSIEQAYGLMAGFGMQLWGIVQDLSQLARIYGEHGWQTFISNSGVIQYFGSRDKMTAEYFSSLCGVTTVEVVNTSSGISRMFGSSSSHGPGGGGSGSSEGSTHSQTTGINEAQRQLAYPDELMVLKGHQQIVFVENLDPIKATKMVWYNHPGLAPIGKNLQPPVKAVAA